MQSQTESFQSGAPQTDDEMPQAASGTVKLDERTASSTSSVAPQACCGDQKAVSTNSSAPSYIYAIGNIRPAYTSFSLEMVFNQAVAHSKTSSPDYALQFEVLSQGENVYITREMCWIMQSGGVDAYIVKPRTYLELFNMVEAIEPTQVQSIRRYDVVIGPRGPIAPPELCSGLQLPLVVCNQLYSFLFDEFVAAISTATGVAHEDAASMFFEMLQVGDNVGETDEHRAINYVTLRYPSIYVMAANMLGHAPAGPYSIADRVYTLAGVAATRAPVQGARRIVDIIFRYRERATGAMVDWYCEVDVTGQFPFLVRPLSRYYPYV